MNKTKASKSLRLIAFFLVAIILICAFGFTADGWQFKKNNTNSPLQNGSSDISPEANAPENTTKDPNDTETEELPKFYNRLTGAETTEELSNTRHTAFVLSPSSQMYGISCSDLLIEFPIEDGSTRLLSFINAPKSIAKLGTLSKTRGYISNLSMAFDSTILAYGNDDTVEYPQCFIDAQFTDEEKISNLVYTEFARFTYTSGEMIEKAFSNTNTSAITSEGYIPFTFNDADSPIKGETYFNKISIPYSASSATSLTYNSEKSLYLFEKNGSQTIDLLNSSKVYFKNCLILFADSTTYENQNSTQMVLNTIGEGAGYYFTEGTAKQISWSLSSEGKMEFFDESASELVINVGTTYISFVKSSKIGEIILS